MVIPTNSNTCSDWRRTCHVSWVKTHELPREFRPARDQFVLLGTAANLWASRRPANDFFVVFFLFLSWEVKQNTWWLVPQETVNFVSLRLPRNCLKCVDLKNICWYRRCWCGWFTPAIAKTSAHASKNSYIPLRFFKQLNTIQRTYWGTTFNP